MYFVFLTGLLYSRVSRKDIEMEQTPSFKKYVRVFWGLFLAGLAGFILMIVLISLGMFGDMPDYHQLENPEIDLASEVYSSDGEILGKYFKSNRKYVEFDELDKDLVDALVATEDIRFYKHSGIDAKGTFRAFLFMGRRGGGSTISQQLALQLFHHRSSNLFVRIKQKLQEWVIAAQLERRYTKEEIIAMYYNVFDFIYNAKGIHSAAEIYFNKTPEDLELEEAAVFVAMVNNPVWFNPKRNPEKCKSRRNTVLSQMVKYNYLDPAVRDSVAELPLEIDFKRVTHKTGLAPHFRDVLRADLQRILSEKNEDGEYMIRKPDGKPYNIYTDGLRIHTTIDSRMQKHAENAVDQYIAGNLQKKFYNEFKRKKNPPFSDKIDKDVIEAVMWQAIQQSERYKLLKEENRRIRKAKVMEIFNKPVKTQLYTLNGLVDTVISPVDSIKHMKGFLQAGLMSVMPATGHVKAWVGGVHHEFFQYDHVKEAKRQVGSTFKPILYAACVKEGIIHPCDEIPNRPYYVEVEGKDPWEPSYGPEFEGMVNYKFALANSMNNIAAYLTGKVNPATVIEYARSLGIESNLPNVASVGLGVASVSLYEMVGAFSCFANHGVYQEPIYLLRIEDKNGNTLVNFSSTSKDAIDEETAFTLLKIMQGTVDGVYNKDYKRKTGTAMSLRTVHKIEYPLAGKTGTTQNNTDGWYMGLSPVLVTGVWVGAEDGAVRFKSSYFGQGAVMALPVWALYMKQVYKDNDLKIYTGKFLEPKDSISVDLDCDDYRQGYEEEYNFEDDMFF